MKGAAEVSRDRKQIKTTAHLAKNHVFDVVGHQSPEAFVDFVDVAVECGVCYIIPGVRQAEAANTIAEAPFDLLGTGWGDGCVAAFIGQELPQQLAERH